MWLKGDLLGPQRYVPATSARLRAQWRQADVENRQAIDVRKQWMRILGFDEQEISDDVATCFDLDLVDELEQLSAALHLQKSNSLLAHPYVFGPGIRKH